jgi:hypothetical protein
MSADATPRAGAVTLRCAEHGMQEHRWIEGAWRCGVCGAAASESTLREAHEDVIADAWTDAQESLQADGQDETPLSEAERVLAEHVVRLCTLLRDQPAPAALPSEWAERIAALRLCVGRAYNRNLVSDSRTLDRADAALADLPSLVADAARLEWWAANPDRLIFIGSQFGPMRYAYRIGDGKPFEWSDPSEDFRAVVDAAMRAAPTPDAPRRES